MIKDFPGNRALDEVSLTVGSGEVVAVVGHNGSGKSTLVKILAGVYTSDGGTAVLSEENGVATELNIVHQDLGLASELTAVENLGITRCQGAESCAPFLREQEGANPDQPVRGSVRRRRAHQPARAGAAVDHRHRSSPRRLEAPPQRAHPR